MIGKIYVGFPCIGKTTLALNDDKFIDIDSSTMMENPDGMGYEWIRRDGLEEIYTNVAFSLVRQGYNVFLSSHNLVTKRLKSLGIAFTVIVPSLGMKNAWIDKANARFLCSESDKDRRALIRIKEHFNEDVSELLAVKSEKIIIDNENYSLKGLIR